MRDDELSVLREIRDYLRTISYLLHVMYKDSNEKR